MSTKKPPLTQLSTEFGAPMGRASDSIPDPQSPIKIYIGLLPMMSDGAYDKGGAYWGIGQPIYRACWYDEEGESRQSFARASSRTDACKQLGIKFSQLARGFREPVYELQGNYANGHGWEMLTCESTWAEIKARKREYEKNEGAIYRIVKKFEKLSDVEG